MVLSPQARLIDCVWVYEIILLGWSYVVILLSVVLYYNCCDFFVCQDRVIWRIIIAYPCKKRRDGKIVILILWLYGGGVLTRTLIDKKSYSYSDPDTKHG